MRERANTSADLPRSTNPLGQDVAAMAFVQSSGLCHGIDEAQLSSLFESGTVLEYGAAETVFSEGSTDDALYLVLEGRVTIRTMRDGRVQELADLDRQGVFGEIAVLTRSPRSAAAVTRTDSRLVRISGDAVRDVADAAPRFGRKLAALMAARRKDAEKKLKSL
jgi:CRP-like cAMP-binding protein